MKKVENRLQGRDLPFKNDAAPTIRRKANAFFFLLYPGAGDVLTFIINVF